MGELAQWKKKQATGALNDRQERRMQFLQNKQDRERMANQAEQVLQRGFEQSRTGAPQAPAPAQDPNWIKGFPGPDMSGVFNQPMQGGTVTGERTQPGIVKINDPETWASHVSNRPQQGLLGQYQGQNIDPGFNPGNYPIDPGSVYQPGTNPQIDAAFEAMKKQRRQLAPGSAVPYMNLK